MDCQYLPRANAEALWLRQLGHVIHEFQRFEIRKQSPSC